MRISLIEYSNGIEDSEHIRPLIDRANVIIQQALHVNRNVLVITDGNLRALGIAGVIRLSKDIELEIIPKMLCDSNESNWKESLFLLAALSKYGSIITSENIHSSTAYKDSLYDIAGRVLAREYYLHKRKPIRQYRREKFYDFSVDGEINFELEFIKNPNGIPQEKVSFDRVNHYNATIQAAMRVVLPYVKEASIRHSLERAIQELGVQFEASRIRRTIPARNREWLETYNLAFDIVNGMGSYLKVGTVLSPSFIVDTWRIWEWLITAACRIGLGSHLRVIPQAAIQWGQKKTEGRCTRVNVFPDVAVFDPANMSKPIVLIDAKYKILSEKTAMEIDRGDLYEAFAFCHATGAKQIFLAYPTDYDKNVESGSITDVVSYEIGGVNVSAIKVAFGSITKQGDITAFCKKLSSTLLSVID